MSSPVITEFLEEKFFFLTGTDEHGQKIQDTAEKEGVRPIDICDRYAAIFQDLTKILNMSQDRFIRTTEAEHHKRAHML